MGHTRESRIRAFTTTLTGPRGTLRAEIARGVAGSLVLTVVSLVLKLLGGILMARAMGADGLGVYSFAMALIALMLIPTQMGLPQLVTREVAALREKREWGLLHGLLRRANQGVGLLGLGMALIGLAVGLVLLHSSESARVPAFLAALPLLPIVALSSLRQATLRGLRHVVTGQMPELLIQPGLFVLALAGGFLLLGAGALSANQAMWLNVGAAVIAFAAGSWFLARKLPAEIRAHEPEYRSRVWLRWALPFMMLASLNIINSRLTTVMLGIFRTDAEVGVYQACLTGAIPIAFGLMAANAVAAPHVSRLWARRELLPMQKLVSNTARVALVVAVPVTLVLVLFGGSLLALFFGEEFRQGSTALALIAVGQLVNAFFGSVGLILNMTGHTRLAVRGNAMAVVLNVILNLVLIPRLGIEGAAIGALVSFCVWNSVLFVYARRKVGVFSLAFGGRRWGPKMESAEEDRHQS